MTTTCARDDLVAPGPDEPLDDAPDELAAEKPPVPEPPLPLPPPELPELPELPAPDTSWPTDKLTAATTPVIGDVRLASARACLASVTWFSAAVTAVSSAVSCAAVTADPAAWSDDSFAASDASVASACATLADSEAELTFASTFPAVTFCPTVTSTEVTCPDVAKLRFACWAGSIVPVDETVCRSVVDAAATSSKVGVAAEDPWLCQIPTPAPTSTTTTPPARTTRCLRLVRRTSPAMRPCRRWPVDGSGAGVSLPNKLGAVPVTAHHHPRPLPQRLLSRAPRDNAGHTSV